MKAALALLALIPTVFATLGIDVSTYVDQFTCLHNYGYDFAIPRAYRSYGAVDPNAVDNVRNANRGGMGNVDVYVFPCVPCGNPENQIKQTVQALEDVENEYGMIWLDIERYAWKSSKEENQQFIVAMADEVKRQGKSVGIYTNYYNWQAIVGLDYTGVSQYPLWYAHYDNNPSFSDFYPFGGWSKPAIKQYNGGTTVCSTSVDENYY